MTDPLPSPPPSPAAGPPRLFDRRLVAVRRTRAAARASDCGFLKDRVIDDIAERLAGINRSFDKVLDLGTHDGRLARRLAAHQELSNRFGWIAACDLSPAGLRAPSSVAADEEALPFRDGAFDLVVSALSLHWINDLPGTLIQIRRALKPDGLFIGVIPGGGALGELRTCLLAAEAELTGSAAMRVSPMLDVLDGARLLQRAGFAMPVSDVLEDTVRYGDAAALVRDLRRMGETAAFAHRAPALQRGIWRRAAALYREAFSDPDGRIRATFEWVTLTGWAPSPSQPQPLRPGSARMRLADALGVAETSAGEQAGPAPRPGAAKV